MTATLAVAGPDRGPDSRAFPLVSLPAAARGTAAVDGLGADLPGVARAYGWEAHALRTAFLSDSTLVADRQGRLLYAEPVAGAVVGGTAAVAAIAPLSATFQLHSRPGAKRIIYLDFNGHLITGTQWNTDFNSGNPINAPAWSLDADASTFNDTERTRIQYIWQRVAEDYAAFDVDVTTELTSEDQITRSSLSDEYYGSRALISPISSYFGKYGGIAYVGVFDAMGDRYKPALIFPENLGPNGESYVAEAVSHEVGHNLNLLHDGTTTGCGTLGTSPCGYYEGQGNWAPIMGVGYYVGVVQFSRGEYANANNLQDDLSIIAGYVGYRPDDHGNTAAAATALPAGASLNGSGVITSQNDVDVFAFSTGDGAVTINLNPDSRSANLDIRAELRDAAGALVASSNPLGALNASFNLNLAAGYYYLHVRGTGEGSPSTTGYSAYGSIGQYTISGTVQTAGTFPPVAAATASPELALVNQSVTFNGSGSFDPDGGSIQSYQWTFSDGPTAPGASVSRSFGTAGAYTATLTVTDDESTSSSTTISVTVNSPPVAVISVSPGTSGSAPLSLTFSGAGSSDGQGPIANYAWNFGDGTTGSGSTVSKTLASAGTYVVTLTVTDGNGATDAEQVTIVATQNSALVVRVESISVLTRSVSGGRKATASVRVTNLASPSANVSGVTVAGTWSGAVTGSASGVTGSTGIASLTSAKYRGTGPATFTVTGLSRSGYTYSPSDNKVVSGTSP